MSADDFSVRVHGHDTATEAFRYATEQARYDYGHAGYTGTIAEKTDFILIPEVPEVTGEEVFRAFVLGDLPIAESSLLAARWPEYVEAYEDKWGPALAVKIKDGVYAFFGVASS